MSIKELINKFAFEVYEATSPPKPEITLLSVTSQRVEQAITDLQLIKLYPVLLDYGQKYYYTNAEGWAEIFDYIYFKFNTPQYLIARMDCEDWAILFKGLVSSLFGLNYFAVVIGKTPAGTHSWNLFMTDEGWLQFEPQTGNAFGLGKKGYEPKYVLI